MELIKPNTTAEIVSKDQKFLAQVLGSRIKATDTIKQNEYLLKIENTKKFSKGNISGWIGMAKSKKTFAVTMLVSALTGGLQLYDKFNAIKASRVLYIDTEQSPSDVQRVVRRIKKMVGSEANLLMYGLRPMSPSQRIAAIELLLKQNEIDVLIIDGVRDLLMNINDAVESTIVMTLLMKWSYDYDIHISTVLHQNKSDGNSRGHIGTELDNKAETILRVSKDELDGDISHIEEIFGRGKGFDSFSFFINDSGIPVIASSEIKINDPENCPY